MASPQLLPAGPLHTSGNQIVDQNGNPVKIACAGWGGGNSRGGVPDGLYATTYAAILNAVKSIGFNCIRILFCDACVINNDYPASGRINYSINADLNGLTCLQVHDKIIAYCYSIGLRVIIDSHNNEGTNNQNYGANQPNGLWYDVGGASDGTDDGGNTGTVSQAAFLAMWQSVATRYASYPAILGYDLRNEPNTFGPNGPGGACTWGTGIVNTDLRLMYETVGNAILAIDSKPLIICEGPQNYGRTFVTGMTADGINYGNGQVYDGGSGDLSNVRYYPVTLTSPNKVVYSVHQYPQETSGNSLDNAGQALINNMTAIWGYLEKENIAPVWIGEMGSYFNGNSTQVAASTAWMNCMISYMNGQTAGGPSFTASQQGIGMDWWSVGVDANGGQVPDFGIFTDWTTLTARSNQYVLYSQLFFLGSGTGPATPTGNTNTSPNGTIINTVGPAITDANGNTWAISAGGQVVVNGVADPTTANVIELAYVSGLIYQENTALNWYSKSVPSDTWVQTASPLGNAPTASPNGTIVNSVGPAITDSNGNLWAISSAARVTVNGVADTVLTGVTELAYVGGQIWAEAAGSLWYYKTLPINSWQPTGGTSSSPLVSSKPRVTAPLTGTVTTGSFVAKDITVSGVTLASGKQVHFEYLLPANYSTNVVYPVLIWLHPDHEGVAWYLGTNTNPNYLSAYDANGFYNTVAFRTTYPAIIIVGYADQTGDSENSAIENWGGWTNDGNVGSGTVYSGDTGPNVFALNGVVAWAIANLSADPTRVYLTGFSLGAIGTEYLLLKYNQVNGNPPIYTAGISAGGGVCEIHGYGAGPSSTDVTTMTNVPAWYVSGAQDTNSYPSHWNSPLWTALAGNSNFPLPGGTAAQARAGTSQYHYWLDPNIGHTQDDSAGNPYPTNNTLLAWLFAQSASGAVANPSSPGSPSTPAAPAGPPGTTWNIHISLANWQPNATVVLGQRVANNGIAYQCVVAGTTAASGGPSGTMSNITDGTAHWAWLSAADFVALSGAVAALPATYTSSLVFQFWNDGPITTTGGVPFFVLSGHTMGSDTLTLTAPVGESIRDAIGTQSLPLTSNSTKGVCFLQPLSLNAAINYTDVSDATLIIDGLQFVDPMPTSGSTIFQAETSNTALIVRNCVFDGYAQAGGAAMVVAATTGTVLFVNCLFIDRQPSSGTYAVFVGASGNTSCKLVNCTFVNINGNCGGIPIQNAASPAIQAINCAIFGYTAPGYTNVSYAYCATDTNFTGGTNGGNNLTGLTASAQFYSTTGDFRLLPGSALIDAALTDLTDIPTGDDIARTPRTQGKGWDIGCYERPAYSPAEFHPPPIRFW